MVIQAFPAGDARVRQAADYHAYVVLLDAPNPGSGQVFDWSLAAEVPPGQRLIIAGGLDGHQRGRGHRPGPAVGRRCGVGNRARTGAQGSHQDAGVHGGGARRRRRAGRPGVRRRLTSSLYDWQAES